MDISVVVPVYGCPAAVRPLCERLIASLEGIVASFEIILVNDCCPRGSWEEIVKVCSWDTRIIGIELSRNFGQIHAITAGLDHSSGDWVVVMDCDLQDRPEGIPELYRKAQEGYDVVFAQRRNRKDSASVKRKSRAFYKVYSYFTDGIYDSSLSNFSISRRIVIDSYCSMREQNRAYTLFINWLGFRQTAIEIEADERFEGDSSYSFKRKMKMALEIITSQSNKPLMFSVRFGFAIAVIAFAYLLYSIVRYALSGGGVPGYTSLIVSLWFLGGIILIAIGVLGIYVGNIFNEVKGRPLYAVRTILNSQSQSGSEGRKCNDTDVS
jgi:glycosyltransferase involved in cell wall biosynthesis